MELWFTEKHTENSGITAKVKETLFTKQTPYQKLTRMSVKSKHGGIDDEN